MPTVKVIKVSDLTSIELCYEDDHHFPALDIIRDGDRKGSLVVRTHMESARDVATHIADWAITILENLEEK